MCPAHRRPVGRDAPAVSCIARAYQIPGPEQASSDRAPNPHAAPFRAGKPPQAVDAGRTTRRHRAEPHWSSRRDMAWLGRSCLRSLLLFLDRAGRNVAEPPETPETPVGPRRLGLFAIAWQDHAPRPARPETDIRRPALSDRQAATPRVSVWAMIHSSPSRVPATAFQEHLSRWADRVGQPHIWPSRPRRDRT